MMLRKQHHFTRIPGPLGLMQSTGICNVRARAITHNFAVPVDEAQKTVAYVLDI